MFLVQEKRKNGIYLVIMQSYRDPETKATKKKRIKNLGYLHDLEKEYTDPISHFKQVARDMTEEKKQKESPYHVLLDPVKPMSVDSDLLKNFGYVALSKIYHDLKLDIFFKGKKMDLNSDLPLNGIVKLLVYGNALNQNSIKQIYRNKNIYFEKMEFSKDEVYESFKILKELSPLTQKWIHERISQNLKRNTELVYCYVSNQYFEDNSTSSPIIKMSLLVDNKGIPISYNLAPHLQDQPLYITPPVQQKLKSLGAKHVVVVGDNGINNNDKLANIVGNHRGYIVSQSVRDVDNETKKFIFSESGFKPFSCDSRIKERICNRKIRINNNGHTKDVVIKERQIVFFNKKYSKCVMAEREEMLLKAKDLIASPGKYSQNNHEQPYNRYINNLSYDNSGRIVNNCTNPLNINKEALIEEAKFDGYYLFLTNELDAPIEDIVNAYIDLWEMEKSFKFNDTAYEDMPVDVDNRDRLEAHYLISFISLTIKRILEVKINRKYPIEKVIQSLKKCSYIHIDENHYVLSYYDQVLEDIGKELAIDFSKRFGTLSHIKEVVGMTKKHKQQK